MWFVDLILTVLVVIGGIQDFRSGEVSNWITIPLLLAGIVACLLRMNDAQGILSAILIVIVTVFFALQTMGGADWKVLVGLFGIWPLAGLAAVLAAGGWGLIEMLRTRSRHVRFPGVTVYAFATALTFFAGVFTMLPINKV